jgi:GNAT superfamily N-acetyltransferase
VAITSVAVLDAPAPTFRSGRPELDQWLNRHGLTATRAGSARVYLGFREAEVVGYFALSAGSIDPVLAGTRTGKGMPRHPIPAILLARMAVAEDAQGRGVGRELVAEAASLTLAVARLVAVRALVVDALDEPAGFYEYVGFTRNEANPIRLEILVKDLELAAGAEQRS